MANYIETGHAKIIANFEDLLSFCAAYGSKYQPTKMAITISALNTSLSEAQANLSAVYTANTAFMNATNKRIEAFEPLKRLATRIINALAATNASDALIDDAKGINRKIQGKRAAKKATQTPNNILPPKEISVSTTIIRPPNSALSQANRVITIRTLLHPQRTRVANNQP